MPDDYLDQSEMSDPGALVSLFKTLPTSCVELRGIVSNLLIHDCFGLHLCGDPPARIVEASRETLPLVQRLEELAAAGGGRLDPTLTPFSRPVGTCRDFSLLLTALLRAKGCPARLRCGFAAYFDDGVYEDHWVTEYWHDGRGAWALADPQLDGAHCQALSIAFDPSDLPEGAFLPAPQAWRFCREQGQSAEVFGHGEVRGHWFLGVDLVRDLLTLRNREVSAWDSWRAAPPESRHWPASEAALLDRIALLSTDGLSIPTLEDLELSAFVERPPWQAA